MLATLQSVLAKAQRGKYAVGSFNVYNLEQVQAVLAAAAKFRSPVIISTSEGAIEYAGLEAISALIVSLAKKHRQPVVCNLDHGHDQRLIKKCLASGYTGIMFDGSRYGLSKNIRLTTAAVKQAKKYRVGVEGELGQVKYPKEIRSDQRLVLADPDQAKIFVRATNVAALAVAIGNSHGLPLPHECLDFKLLAKIRRSVPVPLVLHGASSTPPPALRRTIALGVCKININTDLRLAFTSALRKSVRENPSVFDPCDHLKLARQSFYQVVADKIVVFGSRRKGI